MVRSSAIDPSRARTGGCDAASPVRFGVGHVARRCADLFAELPAGAPVCDSTLSAKLSGAWRRVADLRAPPSVTRVRVVVISASVSSFRCCGRPRCIACWSTRRERSRSDSVRMSGPPEALRPYGRQLLCVAEARVGRSARLIRASCRSTSTSVWSFSASRGSWAFDLIVGVRGAHRSSSVSRSSVGPHSSSASRIDRACRSARRSVAPPPEIRIRLGWLIVVDPLGRDSLRVSSVRGRVVSGRASP